MKPAYLESLTDIELRSLKADIDQVIGARQMRDDMAFEYDCDSNVQRAGTSARVENVFMMGAKAA